MATAQYEVGDPGLDRETGLHFEVTLRKKLDNASMGVNLFYTDFNDFIYLAQGETLHEGNLVGEIDHLPVYLFTQRDASFYGGELYAEWEPSTPWLKAQWRLHANLDWVEGELKNGVAVPYLPSVSLNAGASAQWQLFSLGLDATLAAEQDDPGKDQLATDGYTSFDVHFGLPLETWTPAAAGSKLFLSVRNVTDEEIRYATSTLKDGLPAPGRNIGAGLRLKF